ncbi:MAG: hypothetical protein EYC69_14065 [Bacteroidetes bacterium]|nr:MAG: hypothetical protein EYC69_14065 [Bacteroidota bacterium]
MKEFTDLKKIVASLTDEEYRYELSKNGKVLGDNSSYRILLDYLRVNIDPTIEETELFIYGKGKSSAFKQLVYRSKDRILELWISRYSISNSLFYDDRAKEIFALRKQLIQFDILCLRGLNEIALKLIAQIIQKAKLYEYYDLLVFALYKKLRLSTNRTVLEDYQSQLAEIDFYEDCRKIYHKAEIDYKNLYIHLNEKKKIIEQEKNIEKIVRNLEADVIRTKSKTIRYNYFLFKAEMYHLQDNYVRSAAVWEELIQLVSSNKYLNSTHGLGLAYYNLGRSQVFLFDFSSAKHTLKKAFQLTRYFDPNTTSYFMYMFLIAYYEVSKKEIERNIDILNSYFYSGIIVHYLAAKVQFYNACIKFIQQDYKSSYLLLNDVKALEQDKESWNIAIRILSIMNQIELENYALADTLIENLRKHHERVKKTLPVSKRDEKIIQILTALSRHSYHFRRTFRVKAEAFILLDSLEKEYRWKILSPEMIIFHEWFKAKTESKTYDHFELMPRIIKKYAAVHKGFVPLEEDVEIFK